MTGPNPAAGGKNGRWVKIGPVGVDSASLGIVDPAFAPGKEHAAIPTGERSSEWGELGMGVQFWCGFGDGTYDVWGWIADYGLDGTVDERIAQITITMIDQADLDDWNDG